MKRQGDVNANLANSGNHDEHNDERVGPDQGEVPSAEETSTWTSDNSATSSISGWSNSASMDVQALLVSALNLTQDNHVLRNAIADAINAAST